LGDEVLQSAYSTANRAAVYDPRLGPSACVDLIRPRRLAQGRAELCPKQLTGVACSVLLDSTLACTIRTRTMVVNVRVV
jgi:hypothetical protein